MSRRRTWRAFLDGTSDGMTVLFAHDPRSRLHGVQVSIQGDAISLKIERSVASTDRSLPSGPLEIRAQFDGDTPILTRASGTAEFIILPSALFPDAKQELDLRDALALTLFQLLGLPSEPGPTADGWVEQGCKLDEMLELRTEAELVEAGAKSFFHKLERLSRHDGAVPGYQRIYAILEGRIVVRCGHGASKTRPSLSRRDKDELEIAVDVSNLMRTLMLAEARRGTIGWAFELFATERLACNHPDDPKGCLRTQGVPNGEDFFKFAEFAFLCIQHEIHQEFWAGVLHDLVRASHIYAEHAELEPGLFGYDPNRPPYDFKRIEQLRSEYDDRCDHEFLEDRFTSIVGQSLASRFTPHGGDPLVHEAVLVKKSLHSISWILKLLGGRDVEAF